MNIPAITTHSSYLSKTVIVMRFMANNCQFVSSGFLRITIQSIPSKSSVKEKKALLPRSNFVRETKTTFDSVHEDIHISPSLSYHDNTTLTKTNPVYFVTSEGTLLTQRPKHVIDDRNFDTHKRGRKRKINTTTHAMQIVLVMV